MPRKAQETGEERPRRPLSIEDDPLHKELGRVGALGRYLEPERCLKLSDSGDGFVVLEEPGFRWFGPKDEALLRLKGLADGVGFRYQEAFRRPRLG